MRWEQG